MDDDLYIPAEQACDDCWAAFAMIWSLSDKRRRCHECFALYTAVVSLGTATPAQVDAYSSLMGVQDRQ